MNKATTLSANITTRSNWHWQDNIWTLGLYGTAVGAGTLFLPVEIGTRGPVIFLVMLLLGLPLSLIPIYSFVVCICEKRRMKTARCRSSAPSSADGVKS